MGYGIRVRVKGKRACFTRPEMHTERVSYDVMTPSAARGILESVYWKPAIRWVIDGIEVLNEIKFDSIRRNEVGSKLSYDLARRTMKSGGKVPFLDVNADRQQRNTLYLSDVDYVVSTHFEINSEKAGEGDTPEKHYNIVLRRLRNGQCFNQPYLGCREFPADISLIEVGDTSPDSFYWDSGDRQLGYMLYDLDFTSGEVPSPLFFRAVMTNGFIDVGAAAREMVR